MANSTASASSSEAVTALSVVSAVASLIGSVGNLLVLLAVFKNDNIRTIPDFFITSLAFSDFTVCAVFLPLSIYQFHQQNTGQENDSSSLAKSFLGHVSMVASATNMFAVTIDRVIAIGFPFKYVAIGYETESRCNHSSRLDDFNSTWSSAYRGTHLHLRDCDLLSCFAY